MAVYTQLEFGEIAALVAPLELGRLVAAQGIAAGVENTTYFLEFASAPESARGQQTGRYVLTIAETLSESDLTFLTKLMRDLNARGLPVPPPVSLPNKMTADEAVLVTRGKPALLVPKIAGTHPSVVTPELCRHVGRTLAELHLATLALGYSHESHRSLNWVAATGKMLLPHLHDGERDTLNEEIAKLTEFVSANNELPQAIIHGDLFRDNVLIGAGGITALIDFFSAGTSYLLLDLAIVVNDWCFDQDGQANLRNYNELTAAYCAVRAPMLAEITCWNALLRIAALRFWVSRLNEQLMPGPHAPAGRGKNPAPYHRLLTFHLHEPLPLQ